MNRRPLPTIDYMLHSSHTSWAYMTDQLWQSDHNSLRLTALPAIERLYSVICLLFDKESTECPNS